jgi:predicted transcriptional regulator
MEVRPRDDEGLQMMTREEIAKELGVCKMWVSKYCDAKKVRMIMPYRQIGRRKWFIKKQIDEWNTMRRD